MKIFEKHKYFNWLMLFPTYGAIISVFIIYFRSSEFTHYTKKGLYLAFIKLTIPMLILFMLLVVVSRIANFEINNFVFLIYLMINGIILDYIFIRYYINVI